MESINLYTGGAAIAAPLPVLLILSLPMAGQREELYSLKGATVPYRYAHPDIQLLLINNYFPSKLLLLRFSVKGVARVG